MLYLVEPTPFRTTQEFKENTPVLYSGLVNFILKPGAPISTSIPLIKNEYKLGQINIEYQISEIEVKREVISSIVDHVANASLSDDKIYTLRNVWNKVMKIVGNTETGVILFKNIFALAPNAID